MGGGGDYYRRDVTDRRFRTKEGFSDFASQSLSRNYADKSTLPFNRQLISSCKNPLVCAFDVTGSMGNLPKIIFDKMPMIAGQLAIKRYINDPMISLTAVGDIYSDRAPLQICDFTQIKNLDMELQKLWLEGAGGGQHFESYEFAAYFYTRCYEMREAETPIFLFTGDESFREQLSASDLKKHFGGQHNDTDAKTIFTELKQKFSSNVFLIHRFYNKYNLDKEIVAQWEEVLGQDYIIKLESDLAIADITLGVISIASGTRNLDEYIEDIKSRPLEMGGIKYSPQSKERLQEIKKSLEVFDSKFKKQTFNRQTDTLTDNSTLSKDNKKKKDWKL